MQEVSQVIVHGQLHDCSSRGSSQELGGQYINQYRALNVHMYLLQLEYPDFMSIAHKCVRITLTMANT
jgi:hypothetical protein